MFKKLNTYSEIPKYFQKFIHAQIRENNLCYKDTQEEDRKHLVLSLYNLALMTFTLYCDVLSLSNNEKETSKFINNYIFRLKSMMQLDSVMLNTIEELYLEMRCQYKTSDHYELTKLF